MNICSMKKCVQSLLIAHIIFLSACVGVSPTQRGEAEPANLGVLKNQLYTYQKSGAYAQAVADAETPIIPWLKQRVPQIPAAHAALVLDIDETSLTNWPQLAANDFGYIAEGPCDVLPKGPCSALAWDAKAQAAAIAPTRELFDLAKNLGVKIFFITGRREKERAATAANLQNSGYIGYAKLVMKPDQLDVNSAADYKAAARATIEAQGFTIVANVGDQDSDLAGGHAERAFKLPNPFYFIK